MDTIKVGLIGLGYWGPILLRNLAAQPNCNIVACDNRAGVLDSFLGKYPGVELTSSASKVFEDPDVGAVIIATPPHTHRDLAMQALERGKHVFVEKPLTMDVETSRELVKAADSRGLVLMVGHTFLFVPEVRKVKEILDTGAIGDLLHVESNRKNLGKYQQSGVIWDLSPHDIAMLYYLTGSNLEDFEWPATVTTTEHVVSGISDVADIFMKSKSSGFTYQLNLSWLHPTKTRTTYFVGSKSMIIYDMMAKDKIQLVDRHVSAHSGEFKHVDGPITTIPVLDEEEPLYKELREFLAAVQTNDVDCLSNGQLGLDVVRTIEALQ